MFIVEMVMIVGLLVSVGVLILIGSLVFGCVLVGVLRVILILCCLWFSGR